MTDKPESPTGEKSLKRQRKQRGAAKGLLKNIQGHSPMSDQESMGSWLDEDNTPK